MKFNFNLPTGEWISVAKGALIAGAGVALTYFLQHVTAADFGTYGPIVVGLLSILVNYIRKTIGVEVPPAPPAPPANN